MKDGKDKTWYIYNVCDHQECYREVGSQGVSYTTGFLPCAVRSRCLRENGRNPVYIR